MVTVSQELSQAIPLTFERTLAFSGHAATDITGLKLPLSIVITNNDYRFLVAKQINQTKANVSQIILEPDAKNTAPAIAVAALEAINHSKDETPYLLALPADHVVQDNEAFSQAVHDAQNAARDGKLVTFGVVPYKVETGYGYIQAEIQETGDSARPVEKFIEKPSWK